MHNLHCGINAHEKKFLLQFSSECDAKTRPSKAKVLIWKFFPITHSIIYYNLKAKNSFSRCKSHWGSLNLWGSLVIESFLGPSVIMFSLGFSVMGSFVDFSVIGSSLWSSLQGPPWVLGDTLFKRVLSDTLIPLFGQSALFLQYASTFFFSLKTAIFKKTFTLKN